MTGVQTCALPIFSFSLAVSVFLSHLSLSLSPLSLSFSLTCLFLSLSAEGKDLMRELIGLWESSYPAQRVCVQVT